jgi:hypothetical protein
MSAFGGKADMTLMSAFDPKRTLKLTPLYTVVFPQRPITTAAAPALSSEA